MFNPPTKIQLGKIPKLYSQENVPNSQKKIYMKFFMGGFTWYVSEFDGNDIFYGFVQTPSSPEGSWGYFSLRELRGLRKGFVEVDREIYGVSVYSPKTMGEILRKGG